ncbi:MAG: hypothetical protein JNJ57_07950 [Saprospiraceae bacterium]|nr:hypothetical protein [Saprospiraceae bacterium]
MILIANQKSMNFLDVEIPLSSSGWCWRFSLNIFLLLICLLSCSTCKQTTYLIILHTDMGDMAIQLKSGTSIPDKKSNQDSAFIISILQDAFIQIPKHKIFDNSLTFNNNIPASGTLVKSAGNYYLIQGRRYHQTTLEKWENTTGKKLTPAAREIYLSTGGALVFEGNCLVIGTLVSGKEVLDRIAALPCNQNGRPLREVPCWFEF